MLEHPLAPLHRALGRIRPQELCCNDLPPPPPPEALDGLLTRLGGQDEVLLREWWCENRTQMAMAASRGVKQPTISVMARVALRRLRAVGLLPDIKPEYIRFHLQAKGCDSDSVEAAATFWAHRSQMSAAKALGVSQGCLRHRIFKLTKTLPDTDYVLNALQTLNQCFGRSGGVRSRLDNEPVRV